MSVFKTRSAMRFARQRLAPLKSECRGGVAVIFAFTLPVIIFAVGGMIDYGYVSVQERRLQATADAAAIAAASEMHVSNTDTKSVEAVVSSVVLAHLQSDAGKVSISTQASDSPRTVTVSLSQKAEGFFLQHMKDIRLSARAVANVVGGVPLCVLTLDESSGGSLTLEKSARLTGNGCAVYSNSTGTDGIASKEMTKLAASLICTAGGYAGDSSNYEPTPLTDCPKADDPLASRPAPPIGGCDYNGFQIAGDEKVKANKGQDKKKLRSEIADETDVVADTVPVEQMGTGQRVTLHPGVYCGGMIIGGSANVELMPGVYVIKDGPLWVDQNVRFVGDYVGFYLTGKKATLHFGANTYISLRAPKDGPLAGLLVFARELHHSFSTFQILSDNARVLEGTIYVPQGELYIDADQPIADKSAYTAIIVKSMSLYAGPHLVLNTDYDQTDVPVPDGVLQGQRIVLAE